MLNIFKQFLSFSKGHSDITDIQPDDLAELEPRDRIINLPLPNGELTQELLERFLSKLCKNVWSRAFHYYSTDQLSY